MNLFLLLLFCLSADRRLAISRHITIVSAFHEDLQKIALKLLQTSAKIDQTIALEKKR